MAAKNAKLEKFLEGSPAGVAQVSRDGGGSLSSWVENGFTVTVRNGPNGLPVAVTARRGNVRLNMLFIFDEAGRLAELSGDVFPTVFMPELCGIGGSVAINPGSISLVM